MTPEEENIHLKTLNFELIDQVRDLEARIANITRNWDDDRDRLVQELAQKDILITNHKKEIEVLTRQRDEYKDSFETQMKKRREDYDNRLSKWQKGQPAPEPPEQPAK